MSSGLSKLLDKSFVLGYALPALIFFTIIATVFGCPDAICGESASQNAFAQLTYAVLAVYILAVLLLAMNYGLYRFFEGYVPPIKWLSFSTEFHRCRLSARQAQVTALTDAGADASILQWHLQRDYPPDAGDVLPTAFGNAIRAFELYSYDIYKIDAIGAWPRLLAVVPMGFLTLINEAKALVDLWLNLAGLTLTLGVLSVGVMVVHFVGHVAIAPPKMGVSWGVIAICSFVSAYLTYLMAKSLVPGWGEQVKSAFDCFLPDLAIKLGYAMPTEAAQRRKIWEDVNNQLLYGVVFEQPPNAKTKKGPR